MPRVTVYVVQPFRRLGLGRRLAQGALTQFTREADAVQAGARASASAAGVLVYATDGEPEFDTWSEPRLIAVYGEAPEEAVA